MSWKKALLSVLVLGIAACGGPASAVNSSIVLEPTPGSTTAPSSSNGVSAAPTGPARAGDQATAFAMERQLIVPRLMQLPSAIDDDVPATGYDVPVSTLPQQIRGSRIFTATENSVNMYDAVSGKLTTLVNENVPAPADPTARPDPEKRTPFLATLSGSTYALSSIAFSKPGSGTAPDSAVTEIYGFNIDKPTEEYSWQIPMGPLSESESDSKLSDNVFGISGSYLILHFGSYQSYKNNTRIYNLNTRKASADYTGFTPQRISGDVLLGVNARDPDATSQAPENSLLTAKSLKAATTLWTGLDYSTEASIDVEYFSPGVSIVEANLYYEDPTLTSIRFIDDRTGKDIRKPIVSENRINSQCWYGGAEQSLCTIGESSSPDLMLLDSSSGEVIRTVISAGSPRIMPKIGYFWADTIYGTTERGPIMIDAKTGKDIPAELGFSPIYLNQEFALFRNDNDLLLTVAARK